MCYLSTYRLLPKLKVVLEIKDLIDHIYTYIVGNREKKWTNYMTTAMDNAGFRSTGIFLAFSINQEGVVLSTVSGYLIY